MCSVRNRITSDHQKKNISYSTICLFVFFILVSEEKSRHRSSSRTSHDEKLPKKMTKSSTSIRKDSSATKDLKSSSKNNEKSSTVLAAKLKEEPRDLNVSQGAKSSKNSLKKCIFVNSALKIQCEANASTFAWRKEQAHATRNYWFPLRTSDLFFVVFL